MQNLLSSGFAFFLLRISLAIGFLSAVASRLGLWGKRSSGWQGFVAYTKEINFYLPEKIIPLTATVATIFETVFGLLLLMGLYTRETAYGAAILTALFAVAMSVASGIKEPLDYSVFAFSAGALVLASADSYSYSLDQIIRHIK
ncbi:hypothetical protein GCM10027566_03080 [Arachidicoccus ginsenosidivorans]|uniref:DoxX family protein n=1 Tax=Arachidicoccus ginsenosidivorans TaxID=496057 RepID=A0A5B8VPF2_9BACT|nr:DoxX family protein [Arachidicoccus ginsenosidivorans]QEC72465.1 DoxX family protein [Arachidicoccus ginsenosidivorans]